MRKRGNAQIPIALIEQPLAEAWDAIDAMWRVELLGDARLTQQWKTARNKVHAALERFADLQRLAKYLSQHANAITNEEEPASPGALRADGKTTRKAAKILQRSEGRASLPDRRRARR